MNKDKIKKIIELGRIRFLAGGFLLYFFGFLLAIVSGTNFSFDLFIYGYAIMLPAHLSISYSNNYFDTKVDRYNKTQSISGGTKILIKNPELKNTCKNIAIGLLLTSIILAIAFVIIYSFTFTFLLFVIFGNLLGWFYTAPPLKLAYRGFGEIANMINMGILMPGIGYWIIKGGFDLFFCIFIFALLIYGFIFIIIVEIPDMEGDKKGKKFTLIVRKGRKSGYKILLFSMIFLSIYFLILSIFKFYYENINFIIIYFLSLIPLIIALKGWFNKPFTRKIATKVAKLNLYSLSIYVILVNTYLIFLTLF